MCTYTQYTVCVITVVPVEDSHDYNQEYVEETNAQGMYIVLSIAANVLILS